MTTPVLTFSQDEADEVYDELRGLHVELDPDPLIYGPKRLNNKVAETRKMLDRCERIFLDVSQRLHAVRRRLLAANTDLDLAKKALFASDPETRAGRSVSDREAIASGKLKIEVQEANRLEQVQMSLESVLMVVKAKRTDLKDTQGRLRDQLKLCQEEIGLGNRWGSRTPDAPEITPSGAVSQVQDIEDMLQGVDGEIHVAQQSGEWEDPDPMEEPDESGDDSEEEEPEEDDSKEDEPEEDEPEEDEPEADLDQQLPPTSTTQEIDSFLEDDIVPEGDKPELDESAVDEILSSFEKMD